MAASSKWACLPILLLASFINLSSAARIFPLDTDIHSSSISTTSFPSDDLDWLPVTGLKRKLSIIPSEDDTNDDHSSISTRMIDTDSIYPPHDPDWLIEKDQAVMSNEAAETKTVIDGEAGDKFTSLRPPTDDEFDELMEALKDVGIDNTDGAFDDVKCGSVKCGWGNGGSNYGWGWNQGNGGSNYGWGWNQGNGGSNYGWGTGGFGGGGGSSYGGGGGGGSYGGGGSGGSGSYGGGGSGGYGGGGGGGGYGGGGGGGGYGGGGGGGGYGGGGGRDGSSWGWGWGGGGKIAAASEMSIDTNIAPAPMNN